jgi:hypothetical protein|tara:strand:- start:8698 stop:8898 length:201 start_codon:yes stop_codon:yes gene_type:complete
MKLNKEEIEIVTNLLHERLEMAEMYCENLVEKVVFHENSMFGAKQFVLNDTWKPEQNLLKKLQGEK